jgi:hypothetical protein
VLLYVVIGLVGWFAISFTLAPLVGLALRRCEVLERADYVRMLQARAQHPANRAA